MENFEAALQCKLYIGAKETGRATTRTRVETTKLHYVIGHTFDPVGEDARSTGTLFFHAVKWDFCFLSIMQT